ncbi:MAG: PAS:GGDEF protein [Osedax symbiont Rs2]|nr:MAG: PAS:GGDEF protein [Osedax symbiont Rs2]
MLKELKKSLAIQLVFIFSIAVSIITIGYVHHYQQQQRLLAVEKISGSYAHLIRSRINQALSVTLPLASLIRTQQGRTAGFSQLATDLLVSYPGVTALQLAPDGIIQYVVPAAGHEDVIGHNLLSSPYLNKEAFAARNSGKLTLAGPFDLAQDGYAAIGRLPVYLHPPSGDENFWGFVTVSIRFPQVLESLKMPALSKAGFAYQLSRIQPESGEIQIFSKSAESISENVVTREVRVANSTWTLTMSPVHTWLNDISIILMSLIGVVIITLATFSAILLLRIKGNPQSHKSQISDRIESLDSNLKRLNLALGSARQGWFELNTLSGELLISDGFVKLLGYDPSSHATNLKKWLQSIHPNDRKSVFNLYKECLVTGSTFELEYKIKTADENWIWLHSVGEFINWDKHNNPIHCTGIHTDISQRKRIEFRDHARNAVLESLLRGTSLRDLLQQIATFIEQEKPGALCSILLANAQGTKLHSGVSLTLPDYFIKAIDGTKIGEGVGSCGTAAFTKKRVIVENIQTHPYWQRAKGLAAKAQLAACWSEPIIGSQNQLLGTFAIYQRKPSTPTEDDFKLLEFAVQLSVIAIERYLADEKQRLSSRVFSHTNEGIYITDVTRVFIDVNPAFESLTGYNRSEVLGQQTSILRSDKNTAVFFEAMWLQLIEQGHWQGEIWGTKKDGQHFAARLSMSTLTNDDGVTLQYVCIFSDVTQSKQQQQRLELMAHYDVLTQLPNRTLLAERFASAIAHSKKTDTLLAVCFLDMDNFKPVNDSYGHEIGDQLLIAVAQRIKTIIPDQDTASRQGGDEFVLLLGDIQSAQHCDEQLHQIHYTLAQPYQICGHTFNISVSIGVTIYPDDNADLDTLLRHADYSMYQAKLAGKDRSQFFNPEQDQKIIQRHHQLEEIQQAFTNNEFVLYYQPKVDMKSGEVFGAEALIRRRHPKKGLIPPIEFLPVIEGTELEIIIGDWVINQALKQIIEWQKQGIFFEVSVNISSFHLRTPSFLSALEKSLESHPDLNAKYLQLEILESSALGDLNAIRSILNTCRDELGVNVALDDFGTGYSSLTHLRNLPAGTIKIDQSFVINMLNDPNDYAIVDGVLALARSFDRKVIAEGVETTEHGLMLLDMGCNAAQGYGIARPMPAQDVPNWLNCYTPNSQWLGNSNVPAKRVFK